MNGWSCFLASFYMNLLGSFLNFVNGFLFWDRFHILNGLGDGSLFLLWNWSLANLVWCIW
ncbi:hypothetical protein A9Y76_11890 [Ralstonia insidiosa]|uniref:Uncharacterized protein n=1 Tax=Ralstonia insidiosa TaxID=190721 RepID=A0A191ZYI7_9RALS|nr:hypothetical protein A9Y76_11890 [Ralstonia insidiosa]